jgi:hypothetical protein
VGRLRLQDDSGKREGANKRLIATKQTIPDALWTVSEAETGETATGEDAVVESGDPSDEVH